MGGHHRRDDAVRLVGVSRRRVAPLFLIVAVLGVGASRLPAGELLEPGGTGPRIVTLAPHLAELVHAAGAGDLLVGVSAYTNYPEAVRRLPQVGDAFMIDQERLMLLRPDVLLAWESGTPGHLVDELRERGFRVEVIRTRGLADVAGALTAIGRITGGETRAAAAAREYLERIERLRAANTDARPIRVFYQVSARPVYTVNGSHYISELIEICGGDNVFADLDNLAPLVSEEAVLARNPEVMLAGRPPGAADEFDEWRRWRQLAANRLDNFYTVPADLVGRPTPRLVDAGDAICAALDAARAHRSRAGSG